MSGYRGRGRDDGGAPPPIAPLAPGDPGRIPTTEWIRGNVRDTDDPRCKDYNPNPYVPPPARCDEFVHYAPCPIAQGRERRDIRPWWKRIWLET